MKPPAPARRGRRAGVARRTPLHFVVESTLSQLRRSGIQRVVVEAGRALARQHPVSFVRYDAIEGGLRPFSLDDHQHMWGAGVWPEGVAVDPSALCVGRTLTRESSSGWILLPEVPGHGGMSVERFGRIISQARAAGMNVAAVFYDLIPLEDARYSQWADQHRAYVAELIRCDVVIAISEHSRQRLLARWRDQGAPTTPDVVAVLLPEGDSIAPRPAAQRVREIVLVGTVEPRKRQVEFLEMFERARAHSEALQAMSVRVIGSVHPAVSDRLRAISKRADWLRCDDYVSEAVRTDAVARAAFTVFPSENEGYGLPIAESLALGTPCVCANFGSMAEIAAGGGCVTVDVRDPSALEKAVTALAENPGELKRLRAAISRRRFTSWADYARQVESVMADWTPAAERPRRRILKIRTASEAKLAAISVADIIEAPSPLVETRLIARARNQAWPVALPPIASSPSESRALSASQGAITSTLVRQARSEAAYATILKADPIKRPLRLRIAISTYNRRPFLLANIRWLLERVLPQDGSVDLHVIDGGSTDGTAEGLGAISDPRLSVTVCGADPGMQGGLALAARLEGADYVWIIGDDDFIMPGQLASVQKGLEQAGAVPVGIVNFAVYHRDAWSEADTPAGAVRESRPVTSTAVAPSGRLPLREAVVQNDNLLTAIYTLVWRADVLAAAYDRPRPDPGFSTMQSAAPCSDFLLRHYGLCDAYWHCEPAIAGNAHNSWGARRVEWHGAAMTEAFDLALVAGVDRRTVQDWAQTHAALLEDAHRLYPQSDELTSVAQRRARRLFRRVAA